MKEKQQALRYSMYTGIVLAMLFFLNQCVFKDIAPTITPAPTFTVTPEPTATPLNLCQGVPELLRIVSGWDGSILSHLYEQGLTPWEIENCLKTIVVPSIRPYSNIDPTMLYISESHENKQVQEGQLICTGTDLKLIDECSK